MSDIKEGVSPAVKAMLEAFPGTMFTRSGGHLICGRMTSKSKHTVDYSINTDGGLQFDLDGCETPTFSADDLIALTAQVAHAQGLYAAVAAEKNAAA